MSIPISRPMKAIKSIGEEMLEVLSKMPLKIWFGNKIRSYPEKRKESNFEPSLEDRGISYRSRKDGMGKVKDLKNDY